MTVPSRRVLSDALQEVPLVHHDGTPQSNVARDVFGNITENECGLSFLDPCVAIRRKGDDVKVRSALVNEGQESADGSPRSLHIDEENWYR